MAAANRSAVSPCPVSAEGVSSIEVGDVAVLWVETIAAVDPMLVVIRIGEVAGRGSIEPSAKDEDGNLPGEDIVPLFEQVRGIDAL